MTVQETVRNLFVYMLTIEKYINRDKLWKKNIRFHTPYSDQFNIYHGICTLGWLGGQTGLNIGCKQVLIGGQTGLNRGVKLV